MTTYDYGAQTPTQTGGPAASGGTQEQAKHAAQTAADEGAHLADVAKSEAQSVAADAKEQARTANVADEAWKTFARWPILRAILGWTLFVGLLGVVLAVVPSAGPTRACSAVARTSPRRRTGAVRRTRARMGRPPGPRWQ